MMATAPAKNQMAVQLRSDTIPPRMRAEKRWAPWRARWNAGRGKFDKIPMRADNVRVGLSTAAPQTWFTYEDALKAHLGSKGATAGIGYVMTGQTDFVGIDLDDCIDDSGTVSEWAQEVVKRVDSYTEVSPSGRGLRIFVEANELTEAWAKQDWTNHEVGIEVYGGTSPRFLTVTGKRMAGARADILEPAFGALEWLSDSYKMRSLPAKVEDKQSPVPLVLPESELLSVSELDLPPRARDMLLHGETGDDGDRSRTLAYTALSLFKAGLTEVEVFSTLANNEHAFAVARDHRRTDDAAMLYLWKHHVQKMKAQAVSSMLTLADFERLVDEIERDATREEEMLGGSTPDGVSQVSGGAGEAYSMEAMFGDLDADGSEQPAPSAAEKPAKKRGRFQFQQAAKYAKRGKRMSWMVPGVLPRAELVGVYGESGAGKSFFVLDMLVTLAAPGGSKTWFGKPVKRQFTVAYVAAEGAIGVQDRLQAIAQERGLALEDIKLHVLGDAPNLMEQDDLKHLLAAIKHIGEQIDLIVLDTLAQVTPGANENSSEDMGRALAHAKGLHRMTGATSVLVGHSGKDQSKGQRGWSGLKGAMDAQLLLTRGGGSSDTWRCCTVAKLKDGEGEGAEFYFTLKSTPLIDEEGEFVTDEDGNPITSCVVVGRDAPSSTGVEGQRKSGRKKGRPSTYLQPFMDVVTPMFEANGNAPKCGHELVSAATPILAALPDPPTQNAISYQVKAAVAHGLLVEVGGKDSNRFQLAHPSSATPPTDPDFGGELD